MSDHAWGSDGSTICVQTIPGISPTIDQRRPKSRRVQRLLSDHRFGMAGSSTGIQVLPATLPTNEELGFNLLAGTGQTAGAGTADRASPAVPRIVRDGGFAAVAARVAVAIGETALALSEAAPAGAGGADVVRGAAAPQAPQLMASLSNGMEPQVPVWPAAAAAATAAPTCRPCSPRLFHTPDQVREGAANEPRMVLLRDQRRGVVDRRGYFVERDTGFEVATDERVAGRLVEAHVRHLADRPGSLPVTLHELLPDALPARRAGGHPALSS